MNWTGGGLSRAGQKGARKGLGLTARQKEHYAKVRNGHIKAPSKPPLTENRLERLSVPRMRTRAATPLRITRRDEDDFDVTPPPRRVKRTEPLRLDTEVYDAVSPARSKGGVKEEALEENYHDATRPRRSNQHARKRGLQESIPEENHHEDRSQPSRAGHSQREESSNPEDHHHRQKDDATLAKKRRLLLQRDWVGLQVPRLHKTRYVVPQQDANIGRRRRLKDGHRARYRTSQSIITSPFRKETRRLQRSHSQSTGLANSDMRIEIGEPGREGRAPSSDDDDLGVTSRPQELWSDLLLREGKSWDGDDGVAQSRTSDARRDSSWNEISTSLSHHLSGAELESASRKLDKTQRMKPSIETNESYRQNSSTYSVGSSSRGYPRIHRDNNVWPPPLALGTTAVQKGFPRLSDDAASRDMRPIKEPHHLAQARDVTLRQETHQMVVSSSSTTVHHPQPTRSDTKKFLSRVLERTSSAYKDEDSIIAQDDQNCTKNPTSSEALENAIWDSWAAPTGSQSGVEELPLSHDYSFMEPPRSPNTSTTRQSVVSSMSFDMEENQKLINAANVLLGKAVNMNLLESCYGSDRAEASSSSPIQQQLLSEWKQENSDSPTVDYSQQNRDPTVLPPIARNALQMNPRILKDPPAQTINPDDEWRRFACGTSSEETHSDRFPLSKNKGSSFQLAPASSMLARCSDENDSRYYMGLPPRHSIKYSMDIRDSAVRPSRPSKYARQIRCEGPSRPSSRADSGYKNPSQIADRYFESIPQSVEDKASSSWQLSRQDLESPDDTRRSEPSRSEPISAVNYSTRPTVSSSGESKYDGSEKPRIVFSKPKRFVSDDFTPRKGGRLLHIRRELAGTPRRRSGLSKVDSNYHHAAEGELESIEDDEGMV